MANTVCNSLHVLGPREALERIAKTLEKGESPIQFGQIVPEPSPYPKSANPDIPDWYAWRGANWGPAYEATETRLQDCGDELFYTFETANSPAYPFMKRLAELAKKNGCELFGYWADVDEPAEFGGYGADGERVKAPKDKAFLDSAGYIPDEDYEQEEIEEDERDVPYIPRLGYSN